VIGLIPGIPLILISGLLIKLTSPGPVIYRQTRVGLGGKHYVLFKLRTMRADAEAQGAVWSSRGDSRVTRVGYFLRKWRIDELPQLFNILKGEMSLVGPRPERPEFTEKLAAFIPFYNERHLVQPGLTGWAQVRFPYAASFEAAARKLQFDLYYIKNMSFLLDASILLRTFKTILVGLRHEADSFLPVDEKLEDLLAPVASPEEPHQSNGGNP
jgi:lipopolysaccharide/colanic/teichoic acid biosynthesis glycosyltransferase